MKTLLRIDASARTSGSHSRGLADYYEAAWKTAHPDGLVVLRDLAATPVPHLCEETIRAFLSGVDGNGVHLSDELISEMEQADELLIASPLYNFTLPSTLKAWIDHVVRNGRTFEATNGEYRGLLTGKVATLIATRGGVSGNDEGDHQIRYLTQILGFIGIHHLHVVRLQGTVTADAGRFRAIAEQEVDRLFEPADGPEWIGEFTAADKREIAALREGQPRAILAADAAAYADLCTEDVLLMVPGREPVQGRAAFLRAERELFAGAVFESFEKTPVRVERSSGLIVEAGHQRVCVRTRETGQTGVYAANQKYLHVYRHTPNGWRFAVLSSNPSE